MRDSNEPTRRRFLAGTGAALGGIAAGCAGEDGRGEETRADGDATTDTARPTETHTPTPEGGYAVTMEPMGTVEFESVPETWMAYFSTYGDMAIALGQQDGLRALVFAENWPLAFYDHLPGVDVSFEGTEQLYREGAIDKESFYAADADVHLFDPNFIQVLDDDWTDDDFAEISRNVGPIVGNSIRRRGDEWHDYRYYTLYEAFERVATVFQERERYETVRAVHDEFLADVRSRLPPEDERPTVGLLSINSDFENGSFYAYPVHDGNGHKQYRDLGIRGAFDDAIEGSYAEWDYEKLLAVDPDVLLFQYGFSHVSAAEFEARVDRMRTDPVGKQLTAVQTDRLYRGGTSYQGPVVNLFQTEIAAKQFYPDVFGTWDGLSTLGRARERLFDYERVAAAIRGET